MKILLLLLLVAVVAAACLLLRVVLRGAAKRRLLARAHGIGCSLSEEFGISVLCSGMDDPEQFEALLTPEYTRFEVVAVLDAGAFPEEFARLTARYRMIRVEWNGLQEFPQAGVRSLWRSRRRSCRRFVLVDRPQGAPPFPEWRRVGRIADRPRSGSDREACVADWNAAASVAAYDYLLPLAGRTVLLPDAVTRLVAELGEYPAGRIELICCRLGTPVRLLARDAVVEAGGFAHPVRAARRQRIDLWEPLAASFGETSGRRLPLFHGALLTAALLLAGGAAVLDGWTGAAVLAATAVVAGVLLWIRTPEI